MSDFLGYFSRSLIFLASHSATFLTVRGTKKSSTKEQKFYRSNIFVTLQKTWTLYNNFKRQIGTNVTNIFFYFLLWYSCSLCIQFYCARNKFDHTRGCHVADSLNLGAVQQASTHLPANTNSSTVNKFSYSDGVILSHVVILFEFGVFLSRQGPNSRLNGLNELTVNIRWSLSLNES